MNWQRVNRYGLMGLIGAIGVGIGEFLLHYSSNGYADPSTFGFLKNIRQERSFLGHFIAVYSFPLYFLGFCHVGMLLSTAHKTWAKVYAQASIYIFSLGGIWIGSRALLTVLVKNQSIDALEAYTLLVESLLLALRIGVVLISILFAVLVYSKKTILPRWVAFTNQATLLLFVFLVFFIFPSAGNYLVPTAMNVAHILFFSITLFYSNKTLLTQ